MRIYDTAKLADAKDSDDAMEQLIKENKRYLLSYASSLSGRYVGTDSDEWSVVLRAFIQAIKEYDADRGEFYAFSELVIKRRLIEYFRGQYKYLQEIPYASDAFHLEFGEKTDCVLPEYARSQLIARDDNTLVAEIEAISATMKLYGFDFSDLIEVSPKAEKTKKACAKAISYLLSEPVLIASLRSQKSVPIKILSEKCKLPRKLLERHRKYIITAIEIMQGDYPMLSEYMPYSREGIES